MLYFWRNDKRYTFGGFNYKSSDILKLSPYIVASNGDIDFKKLSLKFKSTMEYMWYYRNVLKVYLENYDNINTYMSVINNKLALVVETTDHNDVLYKKYIEGIRDKLFQFPENGKKN